MTRSRIHILVIMLLALALAAGGAAAAAAAGAIRAGAPGGLTMVICAGDGAVTISVDADGQPVSPSSPHDCSLCPVCAADSEGATDTPLSRCRPHWAGCRLDTSLRTSRHVGQTRRRHPARGPPKGH